MGRQYGTNSISSEEAHAYVDAQRAAAEAARLKTERLVAIAAVVLGLIVLATGIFTKVTGPSRIAELDAEIAAAKEDLSDATLFIEQGGNIKYVDPLMNSAKEAGESLAEIQNQLIVYDTARWVQLRSMPAGSRLDFTDEHKAALMAFQGWVSDANDTTTAMSRSALGIWSYYGKWEFKDTFDYEGDELAVVWVCYDTSDISKSNPLAFVVGKYSAYSNKVHSLVRYITPSYTAMYSRDSLRNQESTQQTEVITDHPSILPYDQSTDLSAGAPNWMTPEQAAAWYEQMFQGGQGTDGGTTPAPDTEQDTEQGGSDVEQWTRP